jgi:hypothetical protein
VFLPQYLRLAGQCEKGRLGHVLGMVPVAHVAQGGGINEVDVPIHDSAERLLRAVLDEFDKPTIVIRHRHNNLMPTASTEG